MPHKHTRGSRDKDGISIYDLPPSKVAEPLAVGKKQNTVYKDHSDVVPTKTRRTKKTNSNNDTPKAFLRLLEFTKGRKRQSGLDNGDGPPSKKQRKQSKTEGSAKEPLGTTHPVKERPETIKIMPGERLSDFAARVDQSLPITGLNRKGKKVPGMRGRQTRQEKKIQKMQDEWRREEARLKEKEEDARDAAEEEDAENWTITGRGAHLDGTGKRKRATKAQRRRGETVSAVDDDPWAVLKERRDRPKGLFDVVQAPPELKKIPKPKFKVRDGAKVEVANVPSTAGSLRRREELGEARQSIIDSYRKIMSGKRSLSSAKT